MGFYNERGELQKTIVVGAVYDGKEYEFVRNLPNGGYGPGEATWIVPHGYEVPNDNTLAIRRMDEPSATAESNGYESLEGFALHYAIFTCEFGSAVKEAQATSLGAKFYNYLIDGGDPLDYKPEGAVSSVSFVMENGVAKEYLPGLEPCEDGKVAFPQGVTEIGENVFVHCWGAWSLFPKSISIPASVVKIQKRAFVGRNFDSAEIAEGVAEIGKEAFAGCNYLAAIELPATLKKMGEGVFKKCKVLATVTLHEGVKEIGKAAFRECASLTAIEIPESVAKIGETAFYGCTALSSITIPKKAKQIGKAAFYGCTSLATAEICEGVSEIGGEAFCGCSSLMAVTIPKSVKKIGDGAFKRCAIPQSFKAEAAGWHFENSLAIKDGAVQYRTNAKAEKITIPEGVVEIANSAFYANTTLTEVEIPESVAKIGDMAFYGCAALKSVAVPAGAEIAANAFPPDCKVVRQ